MDLVPLALLDLRERLATPPFRHTIIRYSGAIRHTRPPILARKPESSDRSLKTAFVECDSFIHDCAHTTDRSSTTINMLFSSIFVFSVCFILCWLALPIPPFGAVNLWPRLSSLHCYTNSSAIYVKKGSPSQKRKLDLQACSNEREVTKLGRTNL